MQALVLHPSETRRPRHQVRASARRIGGSELVTLRFEVEGASSVQWPEENRGATEEGQRRDGLWKQTCIECFLGRSTQEYSEWNFSPNGDWAAYEFEKYREGMRNAEVAAPSIVRTSAGDRARFEIDFAVGEDAKGGATWVSLALSLTAVVIEKPLPGEAAAAPFYWALVHAGAKPDFHLRDSFILEVEC